MSKSGIPRQGLNTSIFATKDYVDEATSGINENLENLQLQINGLDHTTAGYSTLTYVDDTFTTIVDFNIVFSH